MFKFLKAFFTRLIDNPKSILGYIKIVYYNFKGTDSFLEKYKQVNILSGDETLKYLIKNRKSFVRFGDGDAQILLGMSNGGGRSIEKATPEIVSKMSNIFKNSKLTIGLFKYIILPKDSELKKSGKYFNYLGYRYFIQKVIKGGFIYGDGNIFRDKDLDSKLLLNYLENKTVVIVSKKNKNIDALKLGERRIFIEVPSKYAFSKYNEIMNEIKRVIKLKKVKKANSIFLVSAGPTAKILVQDIDDLGFLAWDTGALFDDMYVYKIKPTKGKQM